MNYTTIMLGKSIIRLAAIIEEDPLTVLEALSRILDPELTLSTKRYIQNP